jgi:hypothetical protein
MQFGKHLWLMQHQGDVQDSMRHVEYANQAAGLCSCKQDEQHVHYMNSHVASTWPSSVNVEAAAHKACASWMKMIQLMHGAF